MVDRYRNCQPYRTSPPPRKSNHRGLFLLLTVGAVLLGGNFVWRKVNSATAKDVTVSNAKTEPKKVVSAEPISTTTWNELSQQLNASIAAHPELDISVAVIDVNSNTKANYGIQDNFAGASTTKVLTAATFLHQVEIGKESLTQTISGMTAKQQLKQMINRSNNDSWDALNSAITFGVLDSYAHSIGMSSFNHVNNVITAGDEALLLQKLYTGKLINDANRQLLLSYMQNTNNEDMIPAVTPSGATLYHKYGQLDDRLHDAAIIDYHNRPVVVVIYTKGGAATNGTEYTSRVALIKQLAQSVFQIVYNT